MAPTGGATAGKMNPNGAVIYTTNADVARRNVSRTLPLQSGLDGVMVNQTITGVVPTPSFTEVRASLRPVSRRPLKTTFAPISLCACLRKSAMFRRLLVFAHQTILPATILSGRLSAHSRHKGMSFPCGQSGRRLRRSQPILQYGEFEPGDNVLAEVRLRFIVERYLDPGADNIYGNSGVPGTDGIVGTYDDPVDPGDHPFQPRYLYRVLASEEIR